MKASSSFPTPQHPPATQSQPILPPETCGCAPSPRTRAPKRPNKEAWQEHFESFKRYKQEQGRFPKWSEPLGPWARRQRQVYRKGKLSDDKEARLREIGFELGQTVDAAREERLRQLEEYKKKHGDCNVPQRYEKLGEWVHTQRKRAKKGTLPAETRARLDALGFEWRLNPGPQPGATRREGESVREGDGGSESKSSPVSAGQTVARKCRATARREEGEDLSPVRIKPEVLSPVRIKPEGLSPVRKPEDLSPVRRKPEDLSLVRRKPEGLCLSPVRKPEDLSPVRRKPEDSEEHYANDVREIGHTRWQIIAEMKEFHKRSMAEERDRLQASHRAAMENLARVEKRERDKLEGRLSALEGRHSRLEERHSRAVAELERAWSTIKTLQERPDK